MEGRVPAIFSRMPKKSSPARESLLAFGVEILLDLVGGHLRLDAVLRHVSLADPDGGVEDGPAEVVVEPVLVEVAAGEADAAAAVGPLRRPHHRFGPALRLLDVLVRPLRVDVGP